MTIRYNKPHFTAKHLWVLMVAALLSSGCTVLGTNQGGTMSPTPGAPAPRVVLPSLEMPSAAMIQSRTEPPYGEWPAGKTMVPGDVAPISTDAAEAKGLASHGHLNADYATVQNMYRAILLPKLADKLRLAEADAASAQGLIPAVPEARMSFAQYAQRCAGVPLSYVYVRNNFYIERLSQDQITLFLAHADDPGFATDLELVGVVDATYPRVTRFLDRDGGFETGFDMTGSRRFPNDAIIVNLDYAEPDDVLDRQGHYNDLHYSRLAYVRDTVVPALQKTLTDNWTGHVSLFWGPVNVPSA